VRDGRTILVSAVDGKAANGASFEPTVSDNGRWVAFTTVATNLTRDHDPDTLDVVVRDMAIQQVKLVSVATSGSLGTRNSFFPVISGNGKRVSFQSFSTFARTDTDRKEDVYVRDLRRHWTKQASIWKDVDVRHSVANGDISDYGRLVTFGDANDLWVRDLGAKTTTRFWHEGDGPPCQPFPTGTAGRPVISGNGQYVAFSTCATNAPGSDGQFSQVYRMKLSDRSITLVTKTPEGAPAHGMSYLPSLSRSGRYVGFGSEAADLLVGDTTNPDAFWADLGTGQILRASQAPDGTPGNNWNATTGAAISSDGQTLVYQSYSDNLVPGDTSDYEEVFAWHR
jgi:Tol biopolymer transport system component